MIPAGGHGRGIAQIAHGRTTRDPLEVSPAEHAEQRAILDHREVAHPKPRERRPGLGDGPVGTDHLGMGRSDRVDQDARVETLRRHPRGVVLCEYADQSLLSVEHPQSIVPRRAQALERRVEGHILWHRHR